MKTRGEREKKLSMRVSLRIVDMPPDMFTALSERKQVSCHARILLAYFNFCDCR
jgi:hypothetical protein